jgi:hypothetical protein
LQDKADFITDEIENCRPAYTPIDSQRLEQIRGALYLHDLWMESGGIPLWREEMFFTGEELLGQQNRALAS